MGDAGFKCNGAQVVVVGPDAKRESVKEVDPVGLLMRFGSAGSDWLVTKSKR